MADAEQRRGRRTKGRGGEAEKQIYTHLYVHGNTGQRG
jgi:hypothetical protein